MHAKSIAESDLSRRSPRRSGWAQTELVVVSWGGAYSASQQKAYHDPYMAMNPDIKILNDDSASEGLSKLRAHGGSRTTSPGIWST